MPAVTGPGSNNSTCSSRSDPRLDLHPVSEEAREVMEQFYKAKTKNLAATLVGIDAREADRRWCSTTCSILGP